MTPCRACLAVRAGGVVVLGRLIAALGCLAAVAGCGLAGTAVDADGTALMVADGFDVTDPVLLQSTWWTWAGSEPEESNPVSDTTGQYCDRGQQVGVWLLAGSFGETVTRRCAAPAGVPFAGPVINLVARTRTACEEFMRDASGLAKLGNLPLPLHRMDPVAITYHTVDGNPVTGDGGEFRGYACGLWFSEPGGFVPGEYVLTIKGSSGDFGVSVTYELSVSETDD